MSEDALKDCPECETPSLVRKIGTGAGIIFKGGGFYETDFKDRKGSKSDESPSTKSSDSKPTKETTAPAKAESNKASSSGSKE